MRSKSPARTILEPIAVAVALGLLVRAAVQVYSIPSESMVPTLTVGDQVVVTRYFGGAPERGHIVVFRSPVQPNELLIKRVVAVPGDVVDSRLGRLRIAGRTVAEPYLLQQAASGAIGSQEVPLDSYFVLGDNRESSLDSRTWGVVPRSLIVGRARMILWSSHVDSDVTARASTTAADAPAKRPAATRRLFKWLG